MWCNPIIQMPEHIGLLSPMWSSRIETIGLRLFTKAVLNFWHNSH